jgi:hypothetical protein
VTTLSRSVGELTPPGAGAGVSPRARTVIWLAAGGLCLLLLAFLMINPRGAPAPSADPTREMAAGRPAAPPLPDRPPSSTAAPAGPVIEPLAGTGAARPPGPPPPAPRHAPAPGSNPIADPSAPGQKQPSPAPRRKPKLFEDL